MWPCAIAWDSALVGRHHPSQDPVDDWIAKKHDKGQKGVISVIQSVKQKHSINHQSI